MAEPPRASDRDPTVPRPNGVRPVSPCTSSTFSIGMPSFWLTICAKTVSWPWPWEWVPLSTTTDAVALTRIVADSNMPAPPPAAMTILDGPAPQASM